MEPTMIDTWIEQYVKAWRNEDDVTVAAVFSPDATYKTSPFEEAITGHEAISALWRQRTDDDELFTISHEVVAIEGDIAVVKLDVVYDKPHHEVWKDIWIIQLDNDGLCFAFEEWPLSS